LVALLVVVVLFTRRLMMKYALILFALLLSGCATYIDLGDGRYGVTRASEERSPFGTNAGFAYLENCQGIQDPAYFYQKLTFTDCKQATPITPIYSQGVGGQIVGGALTGLGFGLGNAFGGASNGASSSANATSNAVSAPARGHH
jgi:hypothetical protein